MQQPQAQQPQQVTPQQPQTYGGQNQYAQPQPQPTQTGYTQPSADDWLTDPQAATQQYVTGMYQQQVAPDLQQTWMQNASNARELVRMNEREMFDKYGPEIDQMINQMDIRQRTPENIRTAVRLVRSDHLDELVKQQTKAELSRMQDQGVMRADGSVTPSPTGVSSQDGVDFDISKLPPNYAKTLERNRVTASDLRTFLQKTECDPRGISMKQAFDEWMKDATQGDMVMPGEVFNG
jgi:hypothetical protein